MQAELELQQLRTTMEEEESVTKDERTRVGMAQLPAHVHDGSVVWVMWMQCSGRG